MATLTNNKIKDTYQGLIKTNGNSVVSGTNQYLTDGFGNLTPLSVGTNNIGIGTTSTSSYKLDVSGTGRFTDTLTVPRLISTQTTGTAPLTVASTTLVTNLNADLLDGVQGASYLRSDATDFKTSGYLQFNDNISLVLGSDVDSVFYHTGSAQYLDMHTGDFYYRNNTTLRFTFGRTTGNFTNTGIITSQGTGNSSFAGNVGIGTTSPSYKLDVSGTGRFTSTVTATNFITSSDLRLKKNIQDYSFDKKINISLKIYEFISDGGRKRYGVIAQELEKTNPEFVITDEQGYKSVSYIDLLMAKIAELENRLKTLEN